MKQIISTGMPFLAAGSITNCRVGYAVTCIAPHGTVRAAFPHTALHLVFEILLSCSKRTQVHLNSNLWPAYILEHLIELFPVVALTLASSI